MDISAATRTNKRCDWLAVVLTWVVVCIALVLFVTPLCVRSCVRSCVRVSSVLTAVTVERCGVSTAAVMNGSVVTSQVQLRFFLPSFRCVFLFHTTGAACRLSAGTPHERDQGVDTSDISVTLVSRVHLALTAPCI